MQVVEDICMHMYAYPLFKDIFMHIGILYIYRNYMYLYESCIEFYICVCVYELAYITRMAVESYNLPSASWRPRRTIGIISVSHHKGLRSRRTDGLGSSLSGGANQCTSYKTVWKEEKTQYPRQRKWILPYFAFCSIQVSNRLYRTYSYWGWQSALLSFPVQFSLLQLLSCVRLLVTPWTATHQASLSITKPWSLPKFVSIESVMPSNHLIVCHPLLLLPSIFRITRVYSNESVLRIRRPKYWSFSFKISPSNEYSRLISFRMDWLDLLAVQGTLKSLLQHLTSKASILQHSAFFIVQLSHPYMTTGETIA